MKFYFAPLEGVTGFTFRKIHRELFPGIDKYFAPFITLDQKKDIRSKRFRDIDPALNSDVPLVPQVMTNRADQMIWALQAFCEIGYPEIDLNLGCPSGTVVPKRRGAGFLRNPEALDDFFAETFAAANISGESVSTLSVKTRLGLYDPGEIDALMPIYNKYPLTELIIHPRTARDQYTGSIHMNVFYRYYRESLHPVCYNGDIRTKEDYDRLVRVCPDIHAVMIGRGLVANPALVREIRTGEALREEELMIFHEKILEENLKYMQEERNVIMRMNELWGYWKENFRESDRSVRKIRKAKNIAEYRAAVRQLCADCEFSPAFLTGAGR